MCTQRTRARWGGCCTRCRRRHQSRGRGAECSKRLCASQLDEQAHAAQQQCVCAKVAQSGSCVNARQAEVRSKKHTRHRGVSRNSAQAAGSQPQALLLEVPTSPATPRRASKTCEQDRRCFATGRHNTHVLPSKDRPRRSGA